MSQTRDLRRRRHRPARAPLLHARQPARGGGVRRRPRRSGRATSFLGLPLVDAEDATARFPPARYDMFVAHQLREDERACGPRNTPAMKAAGYRLVSYVSSRCSYLSQTPPGDNCFILEDNTIQPFVTIGNNVTLWSGNHIGHDCDHRGSLLHHLARRRLRARARRHAIVHRRQRDAAELDHDRAADADRRRRDHHEGHQAERGLHARARQAVLEVERRDRAVSAAVAAACGPPAARHVARAPWAATHAALPVVEPLGRRPVGAVSEPSRRARAARESAAPSDDVRRAGAGAARPGPGARSRPARRIRRQRRHHLCLVTRGDDRLSTTPAGAAASPCRSTSPPASRSARTADPFERVSPAPLLDRNAGRSVPDRVAVRARRRRALADVVRLGNRVAAARTSGPRHYYNIRYAESRDGLTWQREGAVCLDYASPDEHAFARPWVVRDATAIACGVAVRGQRYRIELRASPPTV